MVDAVFFKLLLVLSKLVLLGHLQKVQNSHISAQTNCSQNRADPIIFGVLFIGVFEMQPSRVGDVETVEQEQSDEYLLKEELPNFLQFLELVR